MKLFKLLLILCISFSFSQTNEPNELLNLALTEDAYVYGSVDNGRGIPTDILYDPSTSSYFTTSYYGEYGVKYSSLVDIDKEFFWGVKWEETKFINYITFGGTYPNQPQENTPWQIVYRIGNFWLELDSGIGGWIDSGIYEWKSLDMQPIKADEIRVVSRSTETNRLKSIHLRSRGGKNRGGDDTDTETKATLIQLLDYVPIKPKPINVAQGVINAMDSLKKELVDMKVQSNINAKKLEVLNRRLNPPVALTADLFLGNDINKCDTAISSHKLNSPIELSKYKIILSNAVLTIPDGIFLEGKKITVADAITSGRIDFRCSNDVIIINKI